jgi:hypothetical protein
MTLYNGVKIGVQRGICPQWQITQHKRSRTKPDGFVVLGTLAEIACQEIKKVIALINDPRLRVPAIRGARKRKIIDGLSKKERETWR